MLSVKNEKGEEVMVYKEPSSVVSCVTIRCVRLSLCSDFIDYACGWSISYTRLLELGFDHLVKYTTL